MPIVVIQNISKISKVFVVIYVIDIFKLRFRYLFPNKRKQRNTQQNAGPSMVHDTNIDFNGFQTRSLKLR